MSRIFILALLFLTSRLPVYAVETQRPNFLFIAIDDLNDFAGYTAEEPGNFLQVIYPDAEVRAEVCDRLTPNLDRLARKSAPFMRAYCPSALCGPSRTSLMTGVPPFQSGYYLHDRHFRTYDTLKDAVTLPQQLKQSGYFTTGLGKLFHKPTGTVDGPLKNDWSDARHSWSQWINHSSGCNGGKPSKYSPPNGGNMVFGPSRLKLEQSGDWMTADFAARLIENGTAKITGDGKRGKDGPDSVTLPDDRPFFLGCGLFRPHLPFHAPQDYFDLFPTEQMTGLNRQSLDSIIADLDDLPSGAERFSDFTGGKMKVVMDHARSIGGVDAEIPAWREMVQSYLGCVAFADACLGRILDGYEKSPQRDNTVLFLWSDHGYHLGAKYHVAKQALWEEANRVQFIVHDPRKPGSCDGRLRHQLVNLNDLYPTICELAGTNVGPQVAVGKSIVSIIDDVDAKPVHEHLLMTYMKGNHSIRTATHKLNHYKDESVELYNMVNDPSQLNNLAGKASTKAMEESLLKELQEAISAPVLPEAEVVKTFGSKDSRPKLLTSTATKSGNPLQVDGHDFYGADPLVVIADDGRLFMFPTTDNRDWEKQFGWSCYSTENLVDWKNHGVIFSNKDSAWGVNKAWAPDIVKKDGKYYFFYYFNNGGKGKGGVGVAVADQPEGPFRELTKEKLCRGHDPAVFADDDGRYWMYLQDKVYELGDDMMSLKSGPTNLNLEYRPKNFEAAYVFKRNGLYYFTIARGWNNLIYYTGKSPTGPFEFRGEFFTPYGGNNHHSIIKYKDRWVIFYHEWVKNDPVHQRRLRAEYLNFNEDGTIQMVEPTDAGVSWSPASDLSATDLQDLRGKLKLHYSGKSHWDAQSGELEFLTSGSLPDEQEGFYWDVPSEVKRIVIGENVIVKAGLRVRYRDSDNPLQIEGRDRKTSVLYGTTEQAWTQKAKIAENDKWRYGAINIIEDSEVFVENLTSLNPRSYHFSGYANRAVLHVDRCNLFDDRGGDNNNSDGILGSSGSSIRNTLIRTSDDAIKVYHDLTIENVTIEQGRNGAALQFGWGGENDNARVTIRNLKIRGIAADDRYNMAPLSWEGGESGIRNLSIDGFDVDFKGQMYDEPNNRWVPIGLLELKPTACQLNLTIKNGNLHGLSEGIKHTHGKVNSIAADSAKSHAGESPTEAKGDGGPIRPLVWIYTDMSDPTLKGKNKEGTINDPDDVSAMAGYLLMANEFETLGIVVASTHRREHRDTPGQGKWASRFFGEAYRADVQHLKKHFHGFPESISFVESSIKKTAEKFAVSKDYSSLASYPTVKPLFDIAKSLNEGEQINVLCWGSLTEPAILSAHCVATGQLDILKRIRFIAHWTNSSLHQGSSEHPENVANCREDSAACAYMKKLAASGNLTYYECGAIGQHGIVSGGPKGKGYFSQFKTSRLGKIFAEGKFVHNGVDHSDSATYWVLLGNWGVSLEAVAPNGSNSAETERTNEEQFFKESKRIHDELLRRSVIAYGHTASK